MHEYLNSIGVTGSAFVVIISILIAAEVIKSLQSLWSFIADKYLGFKTQYTERKERESLIYQNRDDLTKFVEKQEDFNSKVSSDMDKMHNLMEDVSDSVVQMRISDMRAKILDFTSACSNGRIYTKEQFNYIRKLHEQYENEIRKRGIKNNEISISMEILGNIYEDRVKKKCFIEDKINDPEFQEKVRKLLEEQGYNGDFDGDEDN